MKNQLMESFIAALNHQFQSHHKIKLAPTEVTANISHESLNHGVSVATSYTGKQSGVLITWFSEMLIKGIAAESKDDKAHLDTLTKVVDNAITTVLDKMTAETPLTFAPIICMTDVVQLYLAGNPQIHAQLLDTHHGPIKIVMSQST